MCGRLEAAGYVYTETQDVLAGLCRVADRASAQPSASQANAAMIMTARDHADDQAGRANRRPMADV